MNSERVPVTVLCGFLGAGKTTLLRNLLHDPGSERIVALVNEFGALNIDAELIADRTDEGILLTNGCICCSIQDDLQVALVNAVRRQPAPTRIVLECSGVTHPANLLALFDGPLLGQFVQLNTLVCVVDGAQFPELDYRSTELAIEQAALSDIVFLNKEDLGSKTQLIEIESTLMGAQPTMRIHRTTRCAVPASLLLGTDVRVDRELLRANFSKRLEHGFQSATYLWEGAISLIAFQLAMRRMPSSVLRAKALFSVSESPSAQSVFQLVGKRSSVETTDRPAPKDSWLTVIWSGDEFPLAELESMLSAVNAARVSPGQPSSLRGALPTAYANDDSITTED